MTDDRIRILLLADTHLGYDFPVRPRVERRRRGPDFFNNFQRVLDHAARTKPDMVIHGGDFFFRARVPPKIIDMSYEMLYKFAQTGIPTLIVPGNHERSRLPPSIWLGHPNIHVFDRPRTYIVETANGAVALAGFPFVRGDLREQLGPVIAETGWSGISADVKLLCMHQAIAGAQVGTSNYTFRTAKDVVQMADIPPEFDAVLAGHIHRAQVLKRPRTNGDMPVIYPGSTERTSFAERYEPKGFYEIDIVNEHGDDRRTVEARFHELPTRPMVDVAIDGIVSPDLLSIFLRERSAGLDADAIVRITCENELDEPILSRLTASFLRSVFPATMSVQLGVNLYGEERRPKRKSDRWT
tara:strand:- start:6096 stop:7160 length:1065 start_codon:yes stop_codon:yes gene_type:complete